MIEEWKDIPEYIDYRISNKGRVWSGKSNKYLSLIDHNGYNGMIYKRVDLMKDEIKHQGKLVHRLVAQSFIPNPDNKPEVDHINGDTIDNSAENLRWVIHRKNAHNCKQRTDNTSGVKGVSWDKRGSNTRNPERSKHWRAKISDNNGKQIDRLFFMFDNAVEWRRQKEIEFGYIVRE